MEKRILTFLAACFYYSGLVGLAYWLKRRQGPYLVILNYHRAAENGELRDHLLYLRRHYRVMHLDAALDELYSPNKNRHARTDRRAPIVVTLDDGYYDNYTHGLAAAGELQTPITIFLIPGYIDSGARFWWLEAGYLLAHTRVSEATIVGQLYRLNNPAERQALAQLIAGRVRNAASVAEREDFIQQVRQALGNPTELTEEDRLALPITWEQALEMDKSEWISFGVHTMHHPILGYLSNPEEAAYEVHTSHVVLEQRLGHPLRSFAYPVGWLDQAGYYGVRAVHESGFAWAVTTVYGFNTPETDPYLLRRIEIDVHEHWLMLAAKASGVWALFTDAVRIATFRKR
ncbi:MAG TPA: polysaccharide deacetylase family protein [Ktedonobacteraceae bacterium]